MVAACIDYGPCDLGRPAAGAREAVRWTYLAYLAVLKDHDGGVVQVELVFDPMDRKACGFK